ncbi:MAG: monovalent cation/H(+) antiporter subunit G [Deltaproteobacteria bacterium]|nr:monovalent cation/H(+) antiporter subunit G [Deltaproteobacteria bacterium]MCW5808885.1 monovalent cation/H(+) antiporter subunit G [Deltaproteobacteria bacterium]
MSLLDLASAALLLAGAAFFLAGTVGLLRFPDVYARLHALTKADNLGLGFTVAGLALEVGDVAVALKLGITWALVLVSSSISCQLVARTAMNAGVRPWRRP